MADPRSLLDAFENRVTRRQRHLRRWVRAGLTDCYRLYDRDIPELAFALDVYGPRALLQQYVRRGEAVQSGWLEAVADRAARALGIPPEDVVARLRMKVDRRSGQHERESGPGREFTVSEGGLRFLVNLDTYVDTGLFLDHRPLRQRVRQTIAGRSFLNLFCYTGSFTVHAVAGGAIRSTSVDLSNTYLEWAKRNLALNGLDSPAHEHERADVLAWLGRARERRLAFDCIVLDPPAYSSSKRMSGVFDAQRDHPRLLQDTAALLAPGGDLYFSCNLTGFRFDASLPGLDVRDITPETIPEDFRNRAIHKCWHVRRP